MSAPNPELPQRPVTTRPSPILDVVPRKQPWRPSPWGISGSLMLLMAGLTIALPSVWFSLGAFFVVMALCFWLVIVLRHGLDQPFSSLLLPSGLVFFLLGLEWLVDIPLLGGLVVCLGVWLLWRQFRR